MWPNKEGVVVRLAHILLLFGIYSTCVFPVVVSGETRIEPRETMEKQFICMLYTVDGTFQLYPYDFPQDVNDRLAPGKTYFVLPEYHKDLFTDAQYIPDAILTNKEPANPVLCDWTAMAKSIKLPEASAYLEKFAAVFSDFIFSDHLRDVMKPPTIHFIGEGLGAHFWGLVGRKILEKTEWPSTGRITGLDPLGICFDEKYAYKCGDKTYSGLSKSDATFVDVLFTGREFWGMCDPQVLDDKLEMCHSCFFANAGYKQPGCGNGDGANLLQACSHKRASSIYLESVQVPDVFNSSGCQTGGLSPCDLTLNRYGHNTDKGTEGIFGFATNPEPPFSIPLVCWGDSGDDKGKSSFQDCHISDHNN